MSGFAATERFVELVAGPAPEVPLDVASLLVAAHADPAVDASRWLGHLGGLADACTEPTFAGLRHLLFEQEGFRGDTQHYDDPANSLLHRVLERRRGIPITLSVVVIEVGRRLGLPIEAIGMPGHFLVRDARSGAYCDPFDEGALLDESGCRRRFDAVFAGRLTFSPDMLLPVGSRAVLARMLANLERGPLGRELGELAWMVRLHRAIPGLAPADRLSLAAALQRVGEFAAAADQLALLADVADGQQAAALRREAAALRHRFN